MTTYQVKTGHGDKWWWIEIPEIKGGFSQAKQFRQVAAMAREVIALLLEVPEDSFDIKIKVEGPESEIIAAVEHFNAEAEKARLAAQVEQRKAVKALTAKGMPVRDVAELLHVSAGWVSQLNKAPSVTALVYGADISDSEVMRGARR